jgi:hypothetical protein
VSPAEQAASDQFADAEALLERARAADAALAEEQDRNEALYRAQYDAAGGAAADWIGYQNARSAVHTTPATATPAT